MDDAQLDSLLARIHRLSPDDRELLEALLDVVELREAGEDHSDSPELAAQKALTRRYFEALADAEQDADARLQLADWSQHTRECLEDLFASDVWRLSVGCEKVVTLLRPRRKHTSPVARLQALHDQLDDASLSDQVRSSRQEPPASAVHLSTAMHRMHADCGALLSSRRWRLGKAVSAPFSLVLPGLTRPERRLRETLDAFDAWLRAADENSAEEDTAAMLELLRRLHRDLETFLGSFPWKCGNAAGRGLELLRNRPPQPLAVDRIQETLRYYAQHDDPAE